LYYAQLYMTKDISSISYGSVYDTSSGGNGNNNNYFEYDCNGKSLLPVV
jgi:hypothetical protein